MTGNKLSVKATTLAAAVLWGASVLVVGIANLRWPGYGSAFLQVVDSIYPGYDGLATLRSVLIGTGYGLVDGAVGGFLFAVLYNFFVCSSCEQK